MLIPSSLNFEATTSLTKLRRTTASGGWHPHSAEDIPRMIISSHTTMIWSQHQEAQADRKMLRLDESFGLMCKLRHRVKKLVIQLFLFTAAAYNLPRMKRLTAWQTRNSQKMREVCESQKNILFWKLKNKNLLEKLIRMRGQWKLMAFQQPAKAMDASHPWQSESELFRL